MESRRAFSWLTCRFWTITCICSLTQLFLRQSFSMCFLKSWVLRMTNFPTTPSHIEKLTGCHLEPKRMSLGPPSLQGKCMAISCNFGAQCAIDSAVFGLFFEAKTSNLRKHFDVLDVSRIDEECLDKITCKSGSPSHAHFSPAACGRLRPVTVSVWNFCIAEICRMQKVASVEHHWTCLFWWLCAYVCWNIILKFWNDVFSWCVFFKMN